MINTNLYCSELSSELWQWNRVPKAFNKQTYISLTSLSFHAFVQKLTRERERDQLVCFVTRGHGHSQRGSWKKVRE